MRSSLDKGAAHAGPGLATEGGLLDRRLMWRGVVGAFAVIGLGGLVGGRYGFAVAAIADVALLVVAAVVLGVRPPHNTPRGGDGDQPR